MASATPSRTDHATLADLLRILRVRRNLVVVLMLVVVGTAAVVTALLPKWYLGSTQVRVEKPEGEMQLFQNQGAAYYDPIFLQDQFKIMQAPKILHPVITRLDLNRRIGEMLDSPEPLPLDITTNYLRRKMLDLESPRNSSLININVYAQDPQLAADIANEIARVYAEDRVDFATSEQREGLAKLRQELEQQERTVTRQRDRVEELRDQLDLAGVDLNASYSDMEIETLRQMQNSLIALRVDAIGRKTRWERFRDIPFDDRLNLVNSQLIADQNIQDLLQAYLLAEQMVTRLRARLGEAHPDLIGAVENQAKVREQLDGQLRGYENALQIAFEEANARVEELERQLSEAKVNQILSARDRLRPFEEAAQKLSDETRLLTTLKLTLRQREIDFQVPMRSIELLGEARPARVASKPSWLINLILALTVGLLLGVGVAVGIEYFDTSLRNVAEIEAELAVPVVGVIPTRERGAEFDLDDLAAMEPFRVLHTNLNLIVPAAEPAAWVIVSAGPGEGKSTTINHLAHAVAQSGQRTVLIDGDMRRPTQHELGGWLRGPGLSEFLHGDCELDDILQKQVAPDLDVIGSGNLTGFSFSLRHADRLQSLVTELKARYQRVLFDSPPIIGVSDASILASCMDGAVLLIQHRRNPRAMTLRAQHVLTSARTTVMGAILNQIPADGGEDYGYYAHNYAYYRSENKSRRPARARSRRANGAGDDSDEDHIQFDEPKQ
jgi:polysaccharide biosynthesis transport protein